MAEKCADKWSLDVLYKGLDDPKFAEDEEKLDNLVEELNEVASDWAGQDYPDTVVMMKKALTVTEELTVVASDLMGYLMLMQSTDTTNAAVSGAIGVVQEKLARSSKASVMINRQIAASGDLSEYIQVEPLIADYEYYLKRIQQDASHMLSDDAEEMVSLMNLTGGGAWSKMSDYLTATVSVTYDGKKTNLSTVRNLSGDPDRNVRRAAYEAELSAYPQIADSMAFALNNIKSQVSMLSKKRGYSSVLDMTLEQSDMKRETLDAMLDAMREYMPKFREYMKTKAKILGVGDSLCWYDINAPIGKETKRYTKEEARNYLVSSFSAFSTDMSAMMERAFSEHWIDFDPHPGKVGGAFCAGILSKKESRVLTNFDGSFSSVDTLAHELGHAYHNMQTEDHRPLNHNYCMQVAETASTFNETFIMEKAIHEAEGEEKIALMDSFLGQINQVICDIYSRFLFESEVVDRCENQFLMADDLNDIMIRAQKEAYGDALREDAMHPYMWVCKSHYYSESLSFYNFPYAFGALFAMGLYTQYQKEGTAFVPKYQALLHATPVSSVEDVAMMAGIDVTKKEFWEESLASYAKLIDEFASLA